MPPPTRDHHIMRRQVGRDTQVIRMILSGQACVTGTHCAHERAPVDAPIRVHLCFILFFVFVLGSEVSCCCLSMRFWYVVHRESLQHYENAPVASHFSKGFSFEWPPQGIYGLRSSGRGDGNGNGNGGMGMGPHSTNND